MDVRSPFYIFRHCDTVQKSHFKIFLGNFFQSLKGPPFNFFHILQPAGVSQSPKGPPFTFFDTVTLFNSFFFIFCHQLEFHKTQRVPPFTILSLRYSADFGRSRLVPPIVAIKLFLLVVTQHTYLLTKHLVQHFTNCLYNVLYFVFSLYFDND